MSSNVYRDTLCGDDLSKKNQHKIIISGWVHSKRNHGGVVFIDVRDHTGTVQVVFNSAFSSQESIEIAAKITIESVIRVSGVVKNREESTINSKIKNGNIEIESKTIDILSRSEIIPFQVSSIDSENVSEDVKLKYRFLSLRNGKIHNNIKLRSNVISFLRRKMESLDFMEFQTPILTASSPEGARDFLVPCRTHKGKFYALPQAPQQFKQILMSSGFNKYFQIAPCFRDEDTRSDRSLEFYQLDIEMSFITQEEIFVMLEDVLFELFSKFGSKKIASKTFERISYKNAMEKYGTDKPDLRNPIQLSSANEVFKDSSFKIFSDIVNKKGSIVSIPVRKTSEQSRKFFDDTIAYAISKGAKGLAYMSIDENGKATGILSKFITEDMLETLKKNCEVSNGDSIFFASGMKKSEALKIASSVRDYLGEKLNLIDKDIYKFCWITEFPYFEYLESEKKIDFSHNPFSMPNCTIEELQSMKDEELVEITAQQYDIVCNGIELSSGAIRNNNINLIEKAFEVTGYDKETIHTKFAGLIESFKYGSPPHGGIAPGIDRIVMILADESNIRNVIPFPTNGSGEDLLMNAPSIVDDSQLKELAIKCVPSVLINKNQNS